MRQISLESELRVCSFFVHFYKNYKEWTIPVNSQMFPETDYVTFLFQALFNGNYIVNYSNLETLNLS